MFSGDAPVPEIGKVEFGKIAPLLKLRSILVDCKPFATGWNVTTTVQLEETPRVAPQFPPIPGYEPPLKMKGATMLPESAMLVTPTAPLLVIVYVLSAAHSQALAVRVRRLWRAALRVRSRCNLHLSQRAVFLVQ